MEVFFSPTPNGWKVSILLEELVDAGKLSREQFKIVPVNLGKGEQFSEEFLKVSPNGRMPALRHGDLTVFESGAVMGYICEQAGGHFLGDQACPQDKYDVQQWLFWQVGGLGPMAGQVSHFVNYAPTIAPDDDHEYSLNRYQNEYRRLLGVMDGVLAKQPYLAKSGYSIADMACYGWVLPYRLFGANLDDYPHLSRWYNSLKARPAVQRGVNTLKPKKSISDQARGSKDAMNHLFKGSKKGAKL